MRTTGYQYVSGVTTFIKREDVRVTDSEPLYYQGWIQSRGRTHVLIFDIAFRVQGTRSFTVFFYLQKKTKTVFSSQNGVPRQQTSTNLYISTSITTYTGSTVVRTRSTYSAVQSTTMSSSYCALSPKLAKLSQNTLLTHWKTVSEHELRTTP